MHQPTPSARFQLAVPYILPPSLAALHATRARILYPSGPLFSGTHCVKCGSPLISSDSQTRSVRKKRRKTKGGDGAPVRVLRRSCRTCGHDEDVRLGVSCAPALPKPRDRARRQPRDSSVPTDSPAEMSTSRPASTPPRVSQQIASSSTPGPSRPSSVSSLRSTPAPSSSTPSRALTVSQEASPAQDQAKAKARQKKKSGLQSMLARNRERQEQEKKREAGQDAGLSAFLQGL